MVMKKRNVVLITMLVFLLILTGCGETEVVVKEEKTETVNHAYDKQINLVLKEENEAISYVDEIDRDLKRKECNLKVYDNGEHIYIQYPREKGDSGLEDSYSEVKGDKVTSSDESYIINREPDYEEINIK
ncbi:cystatin-like fold lipoprotein [Listeria seeligeri]|uniref:cystatin-like fold lipoprotein n=1 Tax=Listeria seeligeri TaxID=1640 RepID=UPI00162A8323|nr:cystatin-like fold lipoprotein [Listeria seeligeri]MBC1534017.1 cystatin-like fold lipoprotein [Listeria seeligeri]MBC1739445.1 cystatin-like fold lipoprotein [Listeria seeligeri]MBF2523938.1 cystatin-like fold lipoprotein [Listeria seeligeri]MBF2543373.1 cystatin-like fold lipoprotein [Listeria seeligeri]MBF2563682.1 cystatin-like fold lipoprotein [Listeria seeligeri]